MKSSNNQDVKRKNARFFKRVFRPLDKFYLSRVAARMAFTLFIVLLTILLFYHVYQSLSSGYETVRATQAMVNKTMRTDVYIMRTESPIYSTVGGGSVSPSVDSGSKVSAYSKIAEIFSEKVPDTESRLNEIEEQITLIEKNLDVEHTVQSAVGLEDDIIENISQIVELCTEGNYRNALAMKLSLLLNFRKRSILTGEYDNSEVLSELKAERTALRSELGSCLETIYSPGSGYYFSEYDGYGNIFSPSVIDEMTWDDYEAMINASPEYEDGICAGTLVTDYRWYAITKVSKSNAAYLDEYDNSVYFEYSGTTLKMDLVRTITRIGEDDEIIILSCETMPVDFDFTRCQPVTIYTESIDGFEIPIEAVRVLDGYTGVFVIERATVNFRKINVIYETDTSVICSTEDTGYEEIQVENENDTADDTSQKSKNKNYSYLNKNDTIIVGGKNLKVGKTLS